jgi:tetratricopeptide (TPR) repeat protein
MRKRRRIFRKRPSLLQRLWRVVLVILVGGGIVFVAACDDKGERPTAGVETSSAADDLPSHVEVRAMLNRGEFAQADALFDRVIEGIEDGQRSGWHANRLYGVFNTTDLRVAADVESWMAANPESLHARVARAVYRNHLGLAIRGDLTIDRLSREQIRQWVEMMDLATADLKWVLARKPNHAFAAGVLMGLVLRNGNDRLIDGIFERAIAESPDSGPLYRAYADTFQPWWRREPPQQVFKRLRNLLADVEERYADHPDFRWPKGYFENFQGVALGREWKYTAAIEHYTAALEQRQHFTFYLNRARAYLFTKEKDKAFADLAMAEADYGDRPCGLRSFAEFYGYAELHEKGIAEYTALLACDPLHPELLAGRAMLLIRAGDIAAAKADIDKAMIYGRHSPDHLALRGQIYTDIDPKAAEAAYLSALRESDADFRIFQQYKVFLIRTGSCNGLRFVPAYIASCEAAGKCTDTEAFTRSMIMQFVRGPCGAEQGPPAKRILPMPNDPIGP